MLRKLWHDERGQALIFFAIMSLGLIAITALVIDGGMAFLQRTRVQRAADAATKAGAWTLANGGTDSAVSSAISTYLTNNGWSSGTGSYTAVYIDRFGNPLGSVGSGFPADTNDASNDGDDDEGGDDCDDDGIDDGADSDDAACGNIAGVRVTPTVNFNTFFAGIIGRGALAASASASAIYGPVGSASCLFPTVVVNQTFTPGNCIVFRDGATGPGGFGWVRWAGQNSSTQNLISNLTTGSCNSATIARNDDISSDTGNVTNPVQDALHSWLGQQTTIAIYDTTSGSGNNQTYNIVGFLGLRITDYKEQGAQPATPSDSNHKVHGGNIDADATVEELGGDCKVTLTNATGTGTSAVGIAGVIVQMIAAEASVDPNAVGTLVGINLIQ